jgi:hypothetical protein
MFGMNIKLEEVIETLKGVTAVLAGMSGNHEFIKYQEDAMLLMADHLYECIEVLEQMKPY